MPKIHQEFLTQFDDERKPLVAALLAAIVEACPGLKRQAESKKPYA